MGECLLAERERFIESLGRQRRERAHLESFACSLIQAAYRGYVLRNRWADFGAGIISLNQPRKEAFCGVYKRLYSAPVRREHGRLAHVPW